jgi:transcription antitermination factor NusG
MDRVSGMTDEQRAEVGEGEWFAVRTRAQQERVVRDRLRGQGIEPFLPTVARVSQWSDRKKLIEAPLFSGYCFAKFVLQEKISILQIPGVAYIVGSGRGGEGEPVPKEEIDALRVLTLSGMPYDSCTHHLSKGDPVEIVRGPLVGIRGRLIREERDHYIVIGIHLIQQGATARININDVLPILSEVPPHLRYSARVSPARV